ncbi:MAG: selenium-dependent xanthine dehydrogenase [Anaerolineales bacterium]
MNLKINGKPIEIEPRPGEMLSELLRERLGLTGTKIACNEAECGACTVWVDGEPVLSCTYTAVKAAGREVVTIEGLTPSPSPTSFSSPPKGEGTGGREKGVGLLQRAFVEYGATQCGFCTPGQVMTAAALLRRNPNPTREDIRHALKDTLCRCGAYPAIERAVLAAAEALRTGGELPPPPVPPSLEPLHAVGTVRPRPDAWDKVTGRAVYTDDLHFPGMLHAAVRRAEIPAGILRRLDVRVARELPGVAAVLTAEDLPGERTHGLIRPDWPILVGVGEDIRYVGDALAIVAAESREIALQAAALIEVEIEPLEPITDPVQAHQPGARPIHPGGNLLKHIKVRKGDVAQGFAEADVVLEHTFHTPPYDHAFMEPECSVARPTDDGRMEVYVGSQIPYADRDQVARALGWPDARVRVIGQTMGGGFGGKEDIAGQIHAALLAQATGRPVKLLFDRRESLLVHPKRHATQITVKIGAKRDGTLTAVQTTLYGDGGAYASLSEKVMARATTHSSGPYEIPHVRADCYAMYTNNPPAGAFRGFGALQGQFAIERMMDILARELGLDPIALRRKNALRLGSVTCTGQTLRESVGLLACMEKVEHETARIASALCGVQREDLFKPHSAPRTPHVVHSWGFAAAYKNTGLGGGAPDKAGAEVELYPDGTLEVRTSSAELGQGLVTVLRLIVAEEFNLPPEKVRVLVMDTDLTPDGGPTTASRQTYVTGNAARHAAISLREALASTLAEKYDVPPQQVRFVEGLAQVDGTAIPLGDTAALLKSEGREPKARYEYWAPETKPLGEGGDMHFAFSFAAQAVEVEVNTQTGEVRVLRVVTATDVGKAVNPLGLQGQIEGGTIMGIGHALTENFIIENGVPFSDRLARYRMPNITHTPEITAIVVEDPTAEGPYGAKGVGEIVTIPTIPAICNAIANAVGVEIDRLPVDQERLAAGLSDG